jgi:hypothetical protein
MVGFLAQQNPTILRWFPATFFGLYGSERSEISVARSTKDFDSNRGNIIFVDKVSKVSVGGL